MALIRNCRLPITIITATTLLGLSAILAWGESTDGDAWQNKLTGNWCDAEHGCTHWWTLYEVRVGDDDTIAIGYRDRRNLDPIFIGTIQEPVGTWTIKLKMKGGPFDGREFDAAVSELGAVKAIIEGKFKGSIKAKIQAADIEGIRVHETGGIATISDAKVDAPKIDHPRADKVTVDKVTIEKAEIKEPQTDGPVLKGAEQIKGERLDAKEMSAEKLQAKKIAGRAGREVEISIPIQISEATIEGDATPKGDRGGDDEGESKKVEIKGKIKGKIATSKGQGELKGDFEADFKWLVKAAIKGTFLPLPYHCSEAGSPLSEEQRADLLKRPKATDEVRGEPGRFRSEIEEKEKRQLRDPKLKALGLLEAVRKPPLVVEAAKTRALRPAEPHTRGRFMRKVSGTVSAIDPRTITLDLPPLPVLDTKCSVIDQLPKRTLKLVKQHDAMR